MPDQTALPVSGRGGWVRRAVCRVIDYGCNRLVVLRGFDESKPLWTAATANYNSASNTYTAGPTLAVVKAWLPANSQVAADTRGIGPTLTVTGDSVAIRQAPHLNAPIIGHANRGDTVQFVCLEVGDAVSDPQTGQPDETWIPLTTSPGFISDAFVSPHQPKPTIAQLHYC